MDEVNSSSPVKLFLSKNEVAFFGFLISDSFGIVFMFTFLNEEDNTIKAYLLHIAWPIQ